MPLTPLMRDRLIHRDELDPATKKSNEYYVRRYIQNYLMDLDEILWVLNILPENQLKRIFKNDDDVFHLLEIAERAMVNLDFMPVKEIKPGDTMPKGYENITCLKEKTLWAHERGNDSILQAFSSTYPATKRDIERHLTLEKHINRLKVFAEAKPGFLFTDIKLNHIYYGELIKNARRAKYVPCEIQSGALSALVDSTTPFNLRDLENELRGGREYKLPREPPAK